MLRVNPAIAAIVDPPVGVAKGWVSSTQHDGGGEASMSGAARPLIDVSQATPGEPPPTQLRAHLAEAALEPATSWYAPTMGLPEARTAIAAHFNRAQAGAGATVQAHHVMVTAGCNQAFCLAVGALCGPGDEVVVPTPFYFNHDMWLRANGVGAVYVPATPANAMLPELDRIEAAITPKTRAIVCVTPNNPCGVTYPPDYIDAVFAIARRHDIALLLDETYKDFRAATEPAHRLFDTVAWHETLVHLFSFSKVFSLPGYRVGSLLAAPHVLREAAKLADCETIGAPRIAQAGVVFGLEHLDDWVAQQRHAMQLRLDAFLSAAGALDGYEIVSSGAFFAYVRHPFAESSTAVARRLAVDHAVLTIPGAAFGPHEGAYLRLAFGNLAASAMPELVERLNASR